MVSLLPSRGRLGCDVTRIVVPTEGGEPVHVLGCERHAAERSVANTQVHGQIPGRG
jgi:hypothetical protein